MSRCASCGFDNPPAMKFCGGCGKPLAAAAPQEAERRQLTVMFCDLVGSTALADRLDPEELRALVRAYQQTAGDAIRTFDGHIAQHLGDGLLVYFGYPLAHEDDARRAVHAGLGLLAGLESLNARLPRDRTLAVRIGVHTGTVVTGEIGSGGTRENLALGTTPNIAARLQGIAHPNTIVISAQTYELLKGAFACEGLGRRTLKGFAESVAAFRVIGPASVAISGRPQGRMVGREQELDTLTEMFDGVARGRGAAAMVVAEPGLGKSRVVAALRERLTDAACEWFEVDCSPYEQGSALRPVAALVQRLVDLAGDASDGGGAPLTVAATGAGLDPADTVPLLAALLGIAVPDSFGPSDLSAQKQRERTLEAAVALLLARVASRPVVMLIEDLHWADPSTLDFLRLLISRSVDVRLFALLTSRPNGAPSFDVGTVTQLTLGTVTSGEVERIVAGITRGKPLPSRVLEEIVRRTDGVPLFVEELTKTVLESGTLEERDDRFESIAGGPDVSIPLSLQDSLTARLDRLPSGKRVAQLASVIGRDFTFGMLSAVAGQSDADLAWDLTRLVDVELLYQQGTPPQSTYTFKHALIRDAAYDMLLKSTRKEYHGRIASALIERFPEMTASRPDLVAQHLTEAGEPATAAGYWLLAGQQALRQSATLEAIVHLRRGLSLTESLDPSPQRDALELSLLASLGGALTHVQGYTAKEVELTYLRAQRINDRLATPEKNVWIAVGFCGFRLVRGELEEARRIARDLVERARADNDADGLTRADMLAAWTDFFSGDVRSACETVERVIAQIASHDTGFLDHFGVDMRTMAHSLGALTHWHLGDLARSREYSARAIQLARDGRQANSLAQTLVFAGAEASAFRRDADAVRLYAAELADVCQRYGFQAWPFQAALWLGWADAMQPATAAPAAPPLDPVPIISGVKAMGAVLALGYFSTLSAETLLQRNQVAEADALMDGAIAMTEATGDRMWAAETLRLKARVLLRLAAEPGAPSADREAETLLMRALDLARQQGSKSLELRAAIDLGRFRRREGRGEEGLALVVHALSAFTNDLDAPDLVDARAFLEEAGPNALPYTP